MPQDHTFQGKRGDYVVTLRMRQLYNLYKLSTKYKVRSDVDLDAAAQDFCVNIEKYLNIYPNVEKLRGSRTVD